MLIPVFNITQDDEALWLTIRAPYANVKDTEIEYEGQTVFFYSKPYFLRLYLPGEVADDDTGHADYNSDEGIFTVKIPKKTKGEMFPNLNMLTELLKPSKKPSAEPLIAELEPVGSINETNFESEQAEGKIKEGFLEERILKFGYGFGWRRCGVMEKLVSEVGSLTDLAKPDELEIEKRMLECLKYDQEHFNPEHYLADFYESDESLNECLNFKIPSSLQVLSDGDREHLRELSRRALPIFNHQEHYEVGLSLIDVLYAYLYDFRSTGGEHTVESGWTIVKLSPTLCYFVRWRNARDALISAVRRSLCYPLYRHWDLSQLVVDDLKWLFSSGRTALLHCLMDIRTILSTSGDYRYLLNDLYINDYCIWIQSVHDLYLESLKKEVLAVGIRKTDVELGLEEWELEAKLTKLKINDEKTDTVDSDDEI